MTECKYKRSVSQLRMLRECGEKFRLLKIERKPDRPSAAMVQGIAFHEAYELWERSDRKIDAVATYHQTYDAKVAEISQATPLTEWIKYGKIGSVQKDIEARRERGAEQVETYIDHCLKAPWRVWHLPDESPAVEVDFEIDVGTSIVRGKIDVILEWTDGQLTVRDMKTGNKESSAIQLGLYKVAANECLGLDITYGDYYYAKTGELSDPIHLGNFDLAYLANQFETADKIIEQRLFLASPGSNCFQCPVQKYCREYNKE